MGTGISDTPEDLPKEALRQVAFRLLEDEVRSMPDQAAAGLEEPLLPARQRPTLGYAPNLCGLTAPDPDDRYETQFPLYDFHDNLPG
jgi:hypothetical protein